MGIAAVILAVVCIAVYVSRKPGNPVKRGTTFQARRETLKITVVEGGNVEALESQEIRSEVRGQTKVLSIVEEGYMVTQEDVDAKKVLVELDATDLLEQQMQKELEYQNASAANTEATEQYDIQLNQNESDITTARLDVKFARMDFEKYMGAEAARAILAEVGLGDVTAAETSANTPPLSVDFAKYTDSAMLGDGEAGQKLRTLEDDYVLAKKSLGLSKTQFEGTQRLAEKEFVTKSELENEQLKVEQNEIKLQSAETSRELFVKYEFPKQAEKLLSEHEEALRKLERAKKLAVSKTAQAEANLKSAEARFALQSQKRKELQEQIGKCKITAERPGLVVYGGDERNWRGDDQIQEGATVRERQEIITIPDMTEMAMKVKIHESAIKAIEKGQKATIALDAYPERELTGEVIKVAVLPDSQSRWMNPDVKVYEVMVGIDGVHDWLKPGMSAQVVILVKELRDIVYVPIQAVVPSRGDRVCYIARPGKPERRVVRTGEFNNDFIEIKEGLEEGEEVLLRSPQSVEESAAGLTEGKKEEAGGRRGDRGGGGRPGRRGDAS